MQSNLVYLLILVVSATFTLTSCNKDDEPQSKNKTIIPSGGGSSNGGSSGVGNGGNNSQGLIIDKAIANSSWTTSFIDFCFKVIIKTKIDSSLENVEIKHHVYHTVRDWDNSVEYNDIRKNTLDDLVEIVAYKSNNYLYSELTFPGAIYFATKYSEAKLKEEWSQDYLDQAGDFMFFFEEWKCRVDWLVNGDRNEAEERERIKKLETYLKDMLEDALYDYIQEYDIEVNGEHRTLGRWVFSSNYLKNHKMKNSSLQNGDIVKYNCSSKNNVNFESIFRCSM